MKKVENKSQLKELLLLEKAIVFIFVDWAGTAHVSKKVLTEWESKSKLNLTLFELNPDKSEEISKWIYEEAKDTRGYGSVLWLRRGKILNFEWNAGKAGAAEIERRTAEIFSN